MLESIVEALHGELIRRCPPERPYALSELKSDLLPEPVGRYAADVLRAAAGAELESLDPAGLTWTNLDDEARAAFEAFLTRATAAAAVPTEKWSDVLLASVHRALDHSMKPRTGLVDAVFDGSDDPVEHDELVSRISRLHTGLPLRAAVVRAMKKSAAKSFDRDNFRSLVDRVHDALTLDYTRNDWRKDLEPLQSLLAVAGIRDGCPMDLASAVIDEVGDSTAAEALRAGGDEPVTFETLLDLLSGPEEEVAEAERAASAETPGATPALTSPDPLPLWQRFQKNLNEPIAPTGAARTSAREKASTPTSDPSPLRAPASSTSRARSEPISVEDEESNKPLWQKYRSTHAPELDDLPVSDIEAQILGKQAGRTRESFVETLFDGDETSYYEVLNQLRKSTSWSEASHVIAEEVFKRFQVNIYCDEAVAFTNAVEARFRVNHASD